MMRDYPKHIKRVLRELRVEAHERALERELRKLDESFAAWRAGEIDSGELSYRVHQYDTGPARKLFTYYNDSPPDLAVAYSLVVGLLRREDVPPEVIEAIGGPINFYQSSLERDELELPGEW